MRVATLAFGLALCALAALSSGSVLDPSARYGRRRILCSSSKPCNAGYACRYGICLHQGVLKKGALCSFSKSKCASGLVCAGASYRKLCVAPMSLGGRCGSDPSWICKSGLFCQGGRCVKEIGSGGACNDPFWKCNHGLSCIAGVCKTIKTVIHTRGKCEGTSHLCAYGFSCSKNGFCVKIVDLGGKCNGEELVCKHGQTCTRTGSSHICTKTVGSGNECDDSSLLCKSGYTCSGTFGTRTCMKIINIGEKCGDSETECKPGQTCSGRGSKAICIEAVGAGEKCDESSLLCESGLTCEGSTGRKTCINYRRPWRKMR
eukprot:IDg18980t1